MTDENLSAPTETPAPVASTPEPQADVVATREAPSAEAPRESTRETAKRRLAEVMTRPEPAPEAAATETPADAARVRDERGRFVAQEATQTPQAQPAKPETPAPEAKAMPPVAEPPSRFSPEAKAAWAQAPEPVRAEVSRALGELETGIKKYQAAFEPLKPFAEVAARAGTDLPTALASYRAAETLLEKDFVGGVRELARMFGRSLEDVALELMDAGDAPQPPQPSPLEQRLAPVEQYVTQQMQREQIERQRNEVLTQVEQFAAQAPRFRELEADIARIIAQEGIRSLPHAYEIAAARKPAANLNPAPAPQTPLRNIQISGAPASGSNPQAGPSRSTREAARRALSRVGL